MQCSSSHKKGPTRALELPVTKSMAFYTRLILPVTTVFPVSQCLILRPWREQCLLPFTSLSQVLRGFMQKGRCKKVKLTTWHTKTSETSWLQRENLQSRLPGEPGHDAWNPASEVHDVKHKTNLIPAKPPMPLQDRTHLTELKGFLHFFLMFALCMMCTFSETVRI